jgi:hypothetical protein
MHSSFALGTLCGSVHCVTEPIAQNFQRDIQHKVHVSFVYHLISRFGGDVAEFEGPVL